MHVVIINWKDSAHPEAGGAETYCESIARELVESGDRVTMVVARPEGQRAVDARDGYDIRRMGGTFTVYIRVLIWLFLHRDSIDAVIDSQNGIPFFSPLALRRRTPVALLIHHVHQEQFAMYFPPIVAAVGRLLEGRVSRKVYGNRAVCAVSPSSRTEVRRMLGLRGPIYVVPNGSAPPPEKFLRRSAAPSITAVGRLVPHKRWDLLIDAVSALVRDEPELTVNLIGSGSERENLEARIRSLGLTKHVKLLGYVDDSVRDQLLSRAWLTVSTSVGEGWGLSIIEAAAQGVPAVALDVPGLRDSVRHQTTGWLAGEVDLVKTLREALQSLREPKLAGRMSANCRDWAESLRWSASADRFRAILHAEAARLNHNQDGRSRPSDAVTMVTVDASVAKEIDLRTLRATDQTTFCADCLDEAEGPFRLLLAGADEWDATSFLDRSGISLNHEKIDLTLCRPKDLVQWHASAIQHNALALQGADGCPRGRGPEPQSLVELEIA